MPSGGTRAGCLSFVTQREATAYQETCCADGCGFDQRMRRQLELHRRFEEAPASARVLVVRRDGATTIGMGNRMNNDVHALVLAMHLDRALIFAECAYDGRPHRLRLPARQPGWTRRWRRGRRLDDSSHSLRRSLPSFNM